MSDEPRNGVENLVPWTPGQSGNPAGSSKRSRARAAAKRVGGLSGAMRQLLEETCPESLLSDLTAAQRASIEADPTLARFLAAKLAAAAADSNNPRDTFAALALIGQIDSRHEEDDLPDGPGWEGVFRMLPAVVQKAIVNALDMVDVNDLKSAEIGIPGANERAIRAFVRDASTKDLKIIRHELDKRLSVVSEHEHSTSAASRGE